jgi:phytoene dehydrogenase-like protein
VRVAGESRHFDTVILATNPGLAAELYPAEPLRCWASEAVPVRAAVLDVVLTSLPNPAGRFALGFDQPTYLSVHSAVAKLTDEGRALVTTAWYRRPEEGESDAEIEAGLERSLDIVQPGWRDALLFRRFLPDLTVTSDYVRAATAGLECRPGPEIPGVPGLFVAGDWVGPEGMLGDASVSSGARAGQLALEAQAQASRATLAAAG